jgi:hypothetical protein
VVVVAVHVVAAMDGRTEAQWGVQRPSGWLAGDEVDGRMRAEWVHDGMAWRRMGARPGDGGVRGREWDGGTRGTRRDGHRGQRSGTSMIFFWRCESHGVRLGSGMTTGSAKRGVWIGADARDEALSIIYSRNLSYVVLLLYRVTHVSLSPSPAGLEKGSEEAGRPDSEDGRG